MKIEQMDIDSLKLSKRNPRKINQAKYKKLVQSLKDFPKMLEMRPIVVDENMEVLGGNQRLKAAKECGMKKVPIIKASDLTEEQKKEFIIKDNVSSGEWDIEGLQLNFQGTNFAEWGLDFSFTADYNTPSGTNSDEQKSLDDYGDLDSYINNNEDDDDVLNDDYSVEDNSVYGDNTTLDDYEQEDSMQIQTNNNPTITVEYASSGEKERLIKFLRQFNFVYKID